MWNTQSFCHHRQTTQEAVELSITDKIWDIILDIVAIIANLFSADEEEEIIKNIISINEKHERIFEIFEFGKPCEITCRTLINNIVIER